MCDEFEIEVLEELPVGKQLILAVPDGRIRDIAELDAASWIEPVPPPGRPESNRVRAYIQVDATTGFNGQGVDIGVFESGHVSNTHPDLAGRVTKGDSDPWDIAQHATMTGGFIAGDGSRSTSAVGGGTANQYRGMAPGAQLFTYDFWVGEAATWSDAYTNYLGRPAQRHQYTRH